MAVGRDHTQSVPDIRQTELIRIYTHGYAAFAGECEYNLQDLINKNNCMMNYTNYIIPVNCVG